MTFPLQSLPSEFQLYLLDHLTSRSDGLKMLCRLKSTSKHFRALCKDEKMIQLINRFYRVEVMTRYPIKSPIKFTMTCEKIEDGSALFSCPENHKIDLALIRGIHIASTYSHSFICPRPLEPFKWSKKPEPRTRKWISLRTLCS